MSFYTCGSRRGTLTMGPSSQGLGSAEEGRTVLTMASFGSYNQAKEVVCLSALAARSARKAKAKGWAEVKGKAPSAGQEGLRSPLSGPGGRSRTSV